MMEQWTEESCICPYNYKEEATTKVDSPNADVPRVENTNKDNKVSTGDKINIGVIVMLMMDSAMAALYHTLRRRLMK